jgi:hypothetical protein
LAVAWAAVLAGWTFTPIFIPGDLNVRLVLAAVVATGVSWGAKAARMSGGSSVVVSLLAAVLFLTATVFGATTTGGVLPTATTMDALRRGISDGWRQALTGSVPLDPSPSVLFVPVALTWLAAMIGSELVVRTRARAVTLLPSLAVSGVGIAFSTSMKPATMRWAVMFCVVAGVLLATRAAEPSWLAQRAERAAKAKGRGGLTRPAMARALLFGAPVILGAALIGAVLAPIVPGSGREQFDARDTQEAPIERVKELSPLTRVSMWQRQGTRPPEGASEPVNPTLFTVQSDRPSALRLATLDTYDGAAWRAGNELRQVGEALPPSPITRATDESLHQTITLEALPPGWLPAADRPTSVDLDDVFVDPASGSLYRSDRALSGTTYTVRSEPLRELTGAILDGYGLPADYQIGRYLALPTLECPLPPAGTPTTTAAGVPCDPMGQLRAQAESIVAKSEARRPYHKAFALLEWFQDPQNGFVLDEEIPTGHSATELVRFLEGAGTEDGTRPGSIEQFAAAYAVMARSVGVPAVVVTGFGPPGGDEPTRAVKAANATAWVEIPLDPIGWVPLTIAPLTAEEAIKRLEEQQRSGSTTTTAASLPPTTDTTAPSTTGPTTTVVATPTADGQSRATTIAAVILAVLLVAYLALLAAVRRRRHAERLARQALVARVSGAWEEVLEVLSPEVVTLSMTPNTIARVIGDDLDPTASADLTELADLVTKAMFDKVKRLTENDATRAWDCSRTVCAAIRAHEGAGARVRRAVGPSSLRPPELVR